MVESETKTPQKIRLAYFTVLGKQWIPNLVGSSPSPQFFFMYCYLLDVKPRALVTAGDNGKASDNVCGGG